MKKFLGILNVVAIATLIGMFAWFFWPRPKPVPVPGPEPNPSADEPEVPEGPEKVVHEVFRSLGEGKLDPSKVTYASLQKPYPFVRFSVDKRGRTHAFHGLVQFPLKEVKVAQFDPASKTVKYSVRIPHPCVMYWQWDGVYPNELTRNPPGPRMEGSYKLTRSSSGAWQLVVDNDTNPIALYNKLRVEINRIWFTGIRSGKFSGRDMGMNMIMLFATYAVGLGISEDGASAFADKYKDSCLTVLPKEKEARVSVPL